MDSDAVLKLKTNRKIYYRDDFFRFYNCSEEIPDYLKDFQYLYNNFTQDNWCRKPIPKFEDINEVKGKLSYPINRLKGRQRTLSNQSGENNADSENFKQRSINANAKYSRSGTSVSETQFSDDIKWNTNNTFINQNDFVDNTHWQKVESKSSRPFHSSKSYAQNIQLTENHWKKWSKDSNTNSEKARTQNDSFNRSDRTNNWSKKMDDNRQRNTKTYGMHNLSKGGDQTEDIWQDDWDTEMKSEIAKDDLILDYQFPDSSILSITPPATEPEQIVVMKNTIYDQIPDQISSFDLWFYRDLSDIERGPFPSENMANWLATGYFNPSTFVRRQCDERFLLLAEYRALYGRIPFTAGPTVPPIYLNTPIEIDIKQLLIGVDSNLIHKVIRYATCLSSITQSPLQQNNVNRVEENVKISQNSPEMLALLEEKQMIERTRAELERERERMIQEQVQWRERIEAELKAKMEEIKLSLASPVNNIDLQSVPILQSHLSISDEPIERSYDQGIVDDITESVVDNFVNIEDDKYRQNIDKVMEVVVPVAEILVETSASISEPTDNWFVAKDAKNQKKAHRKSRAKDKENNKAVEEISPTVTISNQTKVSEQPTDSRLAFISKETMMSMVNSDIKTSESVKGRPIRFEMENRKPIDPSTSRIVPAANTSRSLLDIQAEELAKKKLENESLKATVEIVKPVLKPDSGQSWTAMASTGISGAGQPASITHSSAIGVTVTKSLKDIQAEEALQEMREKQLQSLAKASEIEANKITSFKESLLKTTPIRPVSVTTKLPVIPSGKSIWDMSPVPSNTTVLEPVAKTNICSTENVTKKVQNNKKNPDSDLDQLTAWCLKKLAKFSDKFDLHTVIELLHQVPNEEVMELALQLIDDSKFTSNFVLEFIHKRQELTDRIGGSDAVGESWQTVKKSLIVSSANSVPTTPSGTGSAHAAKNTSNKSIKSKPKKKLVVIDAKFR